MIKVDENALEGWMLEVLSDVGWETIHGSEIAPGADRQERASYRDVVLQGRLADAVARLNPEIPEVGQREAVRQLLRTHSANLVEDNAEFHRLLLDGVRVMVDIGGTQRGRTVRFIDFDSPDANDWLAVQQYTVHDRVDGHDTNRRLDVAGFVNGLPLAAAELKNPAVEDATTLSAWHQVQTYKHDIPSFMRFNDVLVLSDGIQALAGSLTAGFEHFSPWKAIDGTPESAADRSALEVLLHGMFDRQRFLTLVRDYVVFSDETAGLVKRTAKYHQFWAVEKAVARSLEAIEGDGRAGVVWHTQGSGKSFEMLCYVAKAMRNNEMSNPTIVLLTDRNDLDDQLHDEVFLPASARGFLPEPPVKAQSRPHLRELLQRPSGGIVFTTIHKFHPGADGDRMPLLTDRENVVVVADEAHRSQYDFLDGFARHMRDALPKASFIGFTGTPIDRDDASTVQVFGNYIDIYDITNAIDDGATVPIYYESRLVQVELPEGTSEEIDRKVELALEGVAEYDAEQVKRKAAQVAAVMGADPRLAKVASDIVEHWERRKQQLAGKAMIVVHDRDIAVRLYDKITALRPGWHDDADEQGQIKLVMTGAATDPSHWQQHVRNKERQRALKARTKDPNDPLEIIIVVDMWLTGFDAPVMHTMYIDKPLKGHTLMQAIARINRTWRDKPAGLLVDYVGITDDLRRAIANYSKQDQDKVGVDLDQAVVALDTQYDIVVQQLHGHDWQQHANADTIDKMLAGVSSTVEWILAHDAEVDGNGRGLTKRYLDSSLSLAKAHALAGSTDRARDLAAHVKYFQTVRAAILKLTSSDPDTTGTSPEAAETALKQIVAASLTTGSVVDVFSEAGLDKPDVSIFSEGFLDEITKVRGYENSRVELLRKLLNDEIRSVGKTSVIQHKRFSEQLQRSITAYRNRAITAAELLEHLIELAREVRDAHDSIEQSGMSQDEYAFYEAIAQNGAALDKLGDDKLKALAAELVDQLQKSVKVDWNRKQTVQAEIRSKVALLLARRGYPPDYSQEAVQLVMQQTELFADKWAQERLPV